MNVGNSLNVDGSITASGRLGGEQAVSAGDAVLLDESGLIPASLLPNTGGETWERIAYNSTLVIGDVYRIRCLFGEVTFIYNFEPNTSEALMYFPCVVYSDSSTPQYRRVDISMNKIYKFATRTGSDKTVFIDASDANCRLYHLIE